MGKLFGTRAYLIGAMDRVPDGGVEWREKLTPRLHELGVMVYNPCDKPIDNPAVVEDEHTRSKIAKLKEEGRYSEIRQTYKSIRNVDLRMVDTCDFLVANINTEVHACGTYEELFWANRSKKPILVHCEQGKKHCPDWLFWTIPHVHIFTEWPTLLSYLDYVNHNGKDGTDRWILFNMEKEIEAIEKHRGRQTTDY